ncbi:MAG TPA: 50S ribosomal protein L1 [Gemmataceae bacterium]|nr:50S ribosomal protein L1 [Gemmataceae bacterium]
MAKKQAATSAETPAKAPEAAAAEKPADEAKKSRAAKKKEAASKAEAAPPADGSAAAPAPSGVAAATAAPAAAPAPPGAPAAEEPTKKRGKRPGQAPPRGKKLKNLLRNLRQKIAKEEPAPLKRAIALLKQIKRAKFDETVEVHMALGIDATQSDQMIRGSVALPHGVGKTVRVLVFCQGDDVTKAKEAGADYAGSDELIKKIQEGWLDFDVALATQNMMGQVSRLGKVLGPRGLMPTPKAGTVIPAGGDVAAAVREFKAGKVEYRSDKGGNVHAGVGKMSFDDDKLVANITAFVEQIRAAKPAGVKGHYIKSITVAGTMTPGIRVSM